MTLEEKIERFGNRWQEIHKTPTTILGAGLATRKYDPDVDDIDKVDPDKIERFGDIVVYPSFSYVGWYDVKSDDGIVVSFAGELAHRNAVAFAKRWGRTS